VGEDHVARAREERVEVVDYDPAWPQRFEEEAAALRATLPEGIIGRIEHFGSTAVPGMPAKPIVDVLVEVPNLEMVRREVAPRLERRGYEFFWRPTSPGAPDIDYAWFIKRDAAGRRTHHVHFLPPDSPYWDRLAFRDLLIGNPAVAQGYASVKRAAAAAHADDREAYARAKGDFIRRALRERRRG
jgi:GrpB-like predicted nucleotidyltransferase (UPF0157 family)